MSGLDEQIDLYRGERSILCPRCGKKGISGHLEDKNGNCVFWFDNYFRKYDGKVGLRTEQKTYDNLSKVAFISCSSCGSKFSVNERPGKLVFQLIKSLPWFGSGIR